jgi:transcriptional regulator with XRE-family HTH domain
MSNLQLKLKTYLQDQNLSVAELERRAGLKTSAVKNILSGQSKKPSGEMLLSISRVFGCTITDLLGEPEETSPSLVSSKVNECMSQNVADLQFFSKATNIVSDLIEHNYKEKTITLGNLVNIIWEVYNYSMKNTYPKVDAKFAEWFIERK